MKLQSLPVQGRNAEMYGRSGLFITRGKGLRYDAGFADATMGHVYGVLLVAVLVVH